MVRSSYKAKTTVATTCQLWHVKRGTLTPAFRPHDCPNKTAGPCDWRSLNNPKATTVNKAQDLTAIHFAICSTNPDVIQKK